MVGRGGWVGAPRVALALDGAPDGSGRLLCPRAGGGAAATAPLAAHIGRTAASSPVLDGGGDEVLTVVGFATVGERRGRAAPREPRWEVRGIHWPGGRSVSPRPRNRYSLSPFLSLPFLSRGG